MLFSAVPAVLATALVDTVMSPTFTVRVDTDSPPAHRVNPLYFGCHSDSGFTHQVRGFSSQMIFGESFEKPQANATYGVSADAWHFRSTGCTSASSVLTETVAPAMHGASSRRITVSSGIANETNAALVNRGLGNEGFFFEGGKPYEGFFFARCKTPVTLEARLVDNGVGTAGVLAAQRFTFSCGKHPSTWVRLNMSLTPTRGTACVGIGVGSDPTVHCTRPTNEAGHACIRCAGEFQLALVTTGIVDLDYVVLQPGPWGRVGELGVKRSTGDALTKMGISAIRIGGSFASVTGWPDGGGGTPASSVSGKYYQWEKWTGPPWLRPSVGAVWNSYSGTSYSLIGGWGPFEVVDMANALQIEPIFTSTSSSSPTELADLVEYCHGDAVTTPFGRKRAADGHPLPYRVRFFELGNEQYNTRFVEQVQAMEARAATLGLNGTLTYIFPDNGGLRGKDIDAAKALGIDAQIAADIHVGAGGGLDQAAGLFASRTDFHQSAVNLETNAGTHTHARALQEAADLNAFFSAPPAMQKRVLVRTASFCTERSGHYDQFDQGIAFFLPNQTWLQPPGHVHAMIAKSRYLNARNVSLVAGRTANRTTAGTSFAGASVAGGGLSVSAQSSDGEESTVVRIVNPYAAPIGPSGMQNISVAVTLGKAMNCGACSVSVLAADSPDMANPSWAPDLVAPKAAPCALTDARTVTLAPLLPFSYSIVEFTGCHKGGTA